MCIFCKISNKEMTSSIIYETKKVICILDVNPVAKGHCLIIPKTHYSDIFDIPEKDLSEITATAKKVAILLKEKLGATGINILHASGKDAQQSVFHFHMHVIPRYKNDGLNAWPKSKYKEKSQEEVKKILI